MSKNLTAILIDVRTQAEWTFVGIPDLTKLGKDLVTMNGRDSQRAQVTPVFAEQLDAELVRNGVKKSASLFFIVVRESGACVLRR